MTISAKIIADSVSPDNIRLTTMQLRYPRFIHAELMTHRVFSRNASSSRAIPVERLIQDIIDDTAMPIHWGANQKGMQADKENKSLVDTYGWGGGTGWQRESAWLLARDNAIKAARAFNDAGYHKQIVNRLLEPFSHINVLVSSTDWANFFALRDHKDAQPEIRELAIQMKKAMAKSAPMLTLPGHWHLPYITAGEWIGHGEDGDIDKLIKCSVARCARVSYLTQDGSRPLPEEDLKLYDRLVGSTPLHASPAEHQATPDKKSCYTWHEGLDWENPEQHGNFRGWRQFRKTLQNENVAD